MAGKASIENGKKGGRPKGSFTNAQLKDYLTPEQIENLIVIARQKSEEGDTTMMKFILDHVFGKAVQPNDVKVQGDLSILFDKVFEDKDETTKDKN